MGPLRDKKIVVTGGGGFLGRHIVKQLTVQGIPHENIFVPRAADFDLTVRSNCEAVVTGKDIVIHAAGLTGGVQFHRDHPGEIFFKNAIMGIELIEAARKAGVEKVLTIGSVTELPEHGAIPFSEKDFWKGAPEPLHRPYAMAKKVLAVQAEAYRSQYDFNAVHLLMTNMYGPGDTRQEGFIIPMTIERVFKAIRSGSQYIDMWGTGEPTRDFLYVEDAAEAVIAAAEKYDLPDPVIVASGQETSIKELAQSICRISGFAGGIKWDTSKPDGQLRRTFDVIKAVRTFGFKARTDLNHGLQKTIDWYNTRT